MPDDKSLWTPEQIQKISKWLTEKWGPTRPCSQCATNSWTVADTPVNLIVGAPDGTTMIGSNYPSIAVFCNNCGNTVLVNVEVAGITPERREGRNVK
jgi:hypothetical protein